jgi:xanthine dehydrogenase/oxidase
VSAADGLTVGAAVTLDAIIGLCHTADSNAPTYSNQAASDDSTTASSSFAALARHLLYVASHQVRGVGSWAGNVMLACHYHDFTSDVFVVLAGLGATVDVIREGETLNGVPLPVLYDMAAANDASIILTTLHVPALWGKSSTDKAWDAVDTFKVALRHENSHAIVNASFHLALQTPSAGAAPVCTDASIVYGGVGKELFVAKNLQTALSGSTLNQATLTAAFAALTKDIDTVGDSAFFDSTPAERRQMAAQYLYKFFLRAVGASGAMASGATRYLRPVSSGAQAYSPDTDEYPVSEAIPKLTAYLQTSGEAIYPSDTAVAADVLHGALVHTTQPLGTLKAIDTTAAAAMPGVVRIITAADIGPDGQNCVSTDPTEPLLVPVGGEVSCTGQQVALVVAETEQQARQAAWAVSLEFDAPAAGTSPIFTIEQATAAGSFFKPTPDNPYPTEFKVGDVDSGMAAAATTVSGVVETRGQRHFYMESQTAVARPTEDGGLVLTAGTQWPQMTQQTAAGVTGLSLADVEVKVPRVGGAYGGKITRCLPIHGVAALAAFVLNKPVSVHEERRKDMETTGSREAMRAPFRAGVDAKGVLTALEVDYSINSGYTIDASFGDITAAMTQADGCYNHTNLLFTGTVCKTNLPTSTSMRAPGSVHAVYVMESVMEYLAWQAKMDPVALREANFYAQGDTTPYGQTLKYVSLPTVWEQLKAKVNYEQAVSDVAAFNAANRWRKRGISMIPNKYGIGINFYQAGVNIRLYPGDGSVQLNHSGCELGQGINTKVAQAVAYALDCPLTSIKVSATDTDKVPTSTPTGGSGTSETTVQAALDACATMNARLKSIRADNPSATWAEIVSKAYQTGVDLMANGWYYGPGQPSGGPYDFTYFVYCAAYTLTEVDVLTGAVEILHTEILFDSGVSLNPDVDIGQVEGAFIMGTGMFLTEQQVIDTETGRLLSAGTWHYKPPGSLDIPQVLNVTMLKDAPNPVGILSSKASGEPPYALSNAVHFSVRAACAAARADAGDTSWVELPVPASPADIMAACGTSEAALVLS